MRSAKRDRGWIVVVFRCITIKLFFINKLNDITHTNEYNLYKKNIIVSTNTIVWSLSVPWLLTLYQYIWMYLQLSIEFVSMYFVLVVYLYHVYVVYSFRLWLIKYCISPRSGLYRGEEEEDRSPPSLAWFILVIPTFELPWVNQSHRARLTFFLGNNT